MCLNSRLGGSPFSDNCVLLSRCLWWCFCSFVGNLRFCEFRWLVDIIPNGTDILANLPFQAISGNPGKLLDLFLNFASKGRLESPTLFFRMLNGKNVDLCNYWLQGWVHSYETWWYHGLMGVNWRLEFASYPSPLKWSFTQKKCHSEVPLDKACRFLEKFGHQPTVFEISSHLEMNVGYFLGDTWLDGFFSDYAIYCLYIVWEGII